MRFLLLILMLSNQLSAAVSEEDFKVLEKDFLNFIIPFGEKVHPNYSMSINLKKEFKGYGIYSGDPIHIFQGVLGSPDVTIDTLAMILCHEIGHDLPIARFYNPPGLKYAFEHLEQDYFAAFSCFRPLIKSSEFLSSLSLSADEFAEIPLPIMTACLETEEYELCLRSVHAGYRSIMGLYRDYFLEAYKDWGYPRPSMSREWLGGRDNLQARIITFIRGSLGQLPLNNWE